MQKRTEFSVSLLLVAPFLFLLLLGPYIPNYNEAWQLHAATRLASGLGYTTYWNVPEDLSGIHGDFLVAWPLGYSVAIEFLMKLGLSVFGAAKLFKVSFILIAAFVWLRSSQQFIRWSFARALFVAYVCAAAVFYSFSPTDLFCWAGMGLLTLLMLTYADSGSARNLAVASTLLGVMILMRYHSLFLLPVVAIWCFLSPSPLVTNRARIFKSAAILLVPVLVYVAIALTNITKEGSLSAVTAGGVNPGFQWVWVRDLPRALLLDGLFFDKVLEKLPLGSLSPWGAELRAIFGWGALAGALMILRKSLTDQDKDRRRLAKWLSLCSIALVLFLGLLTVTRYSKDNWAPLTDGRYYWMLSPMVLLTVLFWIEDFAMGRVGLKWERIGIVSVLAIGLIAISAYGIYRYKRHSNDTLVHQIMIKKLEGISKIERADHIVVFSDEFVRGLLLHGNFPVYKNSDGELPSQCRFSRGTTLIWVLQDAENFAWRSSASMRSDSIGTRISLFWKTFSPGSFSAQIGNPETRSLLGPLPSQLGTRVSSSSQLNHSRLSEGSMTSNRSSRAVCLKPRNIHDGQ